MLAMAALALFLVDHEPKTTKVKVEGATFRVTRAHGEIIVASKAMLTRKSPELSRRMHDAVRQVTGCGLKNEVWTGNLLRGESDCPDQNR